MRQAKCGCWYSDPKPHWKPWYYKRGQWRSWRSVSCGGDEWCRWTLVLGIGPITGVLVIPVWECRGCEDCGPNMIDSACINGCWICPGCMSQFDSKDDDEMPLCITCRKAAGIISMLS